MNTLLKKSDHIMNEAAVLENLAYIFSGVFQMIIKLIVSSEMMCGFL